MTSKEVRERRAKLWQDAKGILDLADKDNKRNLKPEEREKYDTMMADVDALKTDVERAERAEQTERELAAHPGPQASPDLHAAGPVITPQKTEYRNSPQYLAAFRKYLATGAVTPELRALQADIDTGGGYTVPGEQFLAQLIQAVDDAVVIRPLATKFQVTSAESLGVPTLDADPADPNWTAEILTGSEDSTMKFGKRALKPHPLAKRLKVSDKLLRSSALPVEGIVRARLAYKFAIAEEKAFLSGSGSEQPLGVFTASANGISTARDIVTGAATNYTADALVDALYTLKDAYRRAASWLFHRDGVSRIRKLKDGQGQYLWQPGLQGGQPDLILSRPVITSEYVPNTFTTGLYVGMVADFSFYWIADALGVTVQRLIELYAETNQVGFIGRLETDGMPVLEEAFVRIKTS